MTAIEYLAKATAADVTGLSVGSHALEFRPRLKPSALVEDRTIKISADSPAASTMLIFQAVFPFLLFAGTDKGDPITLELSGGTNVSFSLSYEYLDQVLLPTLQDAFGITVERKLHSRGWSLGKPQRGKATFKFTPLKPGETLKLKDEGIVYGGGAPGPDVEIEEVDVSMIVPAEMQESMTETLAADVEELFPGVEINFKIIEDSGADSRIYVLLVAKAGGLRWGRDILASTPKKLKGKSGSRQTISLCEDISRRVSKKLLDEVSAGVVDEFLQDQLVIFQALSEGRTSFPRRNGGLEQAMDKLEISEGMHKDKTDGPFGDGSTHTTTARWVAAQLLPGVRWYNKGEVCEGAGISMGMGKTR